MGNVKIGFDFGSNTSVVASERGAVDPDLITSVVGYLKPNVLPGVMPAAGERFFADEALAHRRFLDLKWPMKQGVVKDLGVARDFVAHVRGIVNGTDDVWAVVGAPARTSSQEQEDLRDAIGSHFARFLIVPEPFLAALGLRDESRLKDPAYVDPVKSSVIIDIGAGTTDLCLLQGFYPSPEDQITFAVAGNDIDRKLHQLIEQKYPDVKMDPVMVTQMKEQHSHVGAAPQPVMFEVFIHGKKRILEVTELIGRACELLVTPIVDAIVTIVKRAPQDIADRILATIVLTGGGSCIGGLAEAVQEQVQRRGLVAARVTRAVNYKRLVAEGGLKVARMARDDQWQHPSLS